MMVKIKKQLISDTPFKYGKNNKKLYITVHETDNWNKGADAQNHADLQSRGNSRDAAWHWQVDDKIAIQSFSHDFQLWHAGDGKGDGNLNSIAVEICVNSDGVFNKAVQNAADLIKKIMKDEHISSTNVVQHYHWSHKNCPRFLRSGSKGTTWSTLTKLIGKSSGNTSSGGNSGGSIGGTWHKVTGDWTGQTLKLYDYGNPVKQLQEMLCAEHFYPDKGAPKHGVDGYYGPKTKDAVERYQKVNLPHEVDGLAGKHVYQSLTGKKTTSKKKSSGTKLPDTVYVAKQPYPTGDGVRAVQEALASVHYYPDKGAKNNGIDGSYGPKTADAVSRFQTMHGLKADGKYGPKTKQALLKAMK